MSYFLDTYGIPLFFVGGIVGLYILILGYWAAADWVSDRLGLRPKMRSAAVGVAVFGASISLFFLMMGVPDYLNDGLIENIYIVEKNNDTRLVVWFVREDEPAGMTTVYSHRIKSFDLDTGSRCGRLTLSRRAPHNDYFLFGPFNQFAWGHSGQKGMAFLDVFEAEVVADEKEILKRNPVLGDNVRLTKGPNGKQFDPVTFGLYVFTANGDIYRIDPDLTATNSRTLDLRNQKHDRATCAVCRQNAQFIDFRKAASGWDYEDESENVLRYRDEYGQTVNTIRLNQLFDDGRNLYAVARVKDERWLFVTMKRYRLSAIRTDARSGEILGVVDYF